VRAGLIPGDWPFTVNATSGYSGGGKSMIAAFEDPGAPDATALVVAGGVAANPGGVLRMTKRLLREGERSSLESLLELSAAYQALAHTTEDHFEAVRAFVEKRAPRFQS